MSVAGSAIYDGLKHFLKRERPTIFHFRVSRLDEIAEGHLETSDEEVLQSAIAAMEQLGRGGRRFEWDDESAEWRSLSPGTTVRDSEQH